MDFDLTENQIMIRDMVRDFAKKHIEPEKMKWDEAQTFPVDVFKKMGEQGLMGILVPE
ncbi:MAG: acyl-CoA dehydrogenase, partial [Bacteroidetes bacterium SW_11_45_7]